MREEFPLSKAQEVLRKETVAILGYGVQDPASLNMRITESASSVTTEYLHGIRLLKRWLGAWLDTVAPGGSGCKRNGD
jgi:hypothetical protein